MEYSGMEKIIVLSLAILWILKPANAVGEPENVNADTLAVLSVAVTMLNRAYELKLLVGQGENVGKEDLFGPYNITGTQQMVAGTLYDLTFNSKFEKWVGSFNECRAKVLVPFMDENSSFVEEPTCQARVVDV